MFNYLRVQMVTLLNHRYTKNIELQQDVIQFRKNNLIDHNLNKTIKYLLLKDPAFSVVYHLRIKGYNRYLGKITKFIYPPKVDCLININTLGPGFVLHHGNSSIITANQVGKNCSIYQQVTIGKGKNINGRNIPNIGNNVTICSGAIVIGGIDIGDNVTIGAGTVVTKDIPNNSTVVGSSFRIL